MRRCRGFGSPCQQGQRGDPAVQLQGFDAEAETWPQYFHLLLKDAKHGLLASHELYFSSTLSFPKLQHCLLILSELS